MKDYDKVVDAMYPGVDLDDKTRQEIISALKEADADDAAAKKDDDLEKEPINTQELMSDFDSMMGKLGKGKCDVHCCTPDEAAQLLNGQMRRVFKG